MMTLDTASNGPERNESPRFGPEVRMLITDLDNTLYDWVDVWYQSFIAQLDAINARTGLPVEDLLPRFKRVHQKHGTSEYAFAPAELFLPDEIGVGSADLYSCAYEALERVRQKTLKLYPGVRDTLTQIRAAGTLIVGFTESMPLYTKIRIVRLGLDGMLDYVYTPPNHRLPDSIPVEWAEQWTREGDKMQITVCREIPDGESKPNPDLLRSLLADFDMDADFAAYVGDSKMRDLIMAQGAGVIDVWAEYGVAQHTDAYALLRAVTHWTPAAVENERHFLAPREPRFTLVESFSEILGLLSFGRYY